MPSANLGTIWPADKHTLAKIAILRGYLNAYFPILGQSRRGQSMLFVDGFAGPGEYTNSPDGSPIAALKSADEAMKKLGDRWIAGDLQCAFIEPEKSRCDRLRRRVNETSVHRRIKTQILERKFVDGIAELRQKFPRPFASDDPLFVFIDPFGATGVPFSVVASILKSPTSEILINLDSDGIARNFCVPQSNVRDELLTSIFGDESWRTSLTATDFKKQCQQILELYKKKLRGIPFVEYVFSFEMRGKDDLLNYHLVFASQKALGLEKMKEAMRGIDKSGSYGFSDGAVGTSTLFNFDDPKEYAIELHRHFLGQTVDYSLVQKFALNESPFINAIAMLKELDQKGQIEVVRFEAKSKGFSADHIRCVHFLTTVAASPRVSPPHRQRGLFDGD